MNTENQPNEQTLPDVNDTNKEIQLELTDEINISLHSAGKWSQFLAIMGFIWTGIVVLAAFAFAIIMAIIPDESSDVFPFPPSLFALLYLVIAAVYFFPILYLYRFSDSIKKAVALKNQTQLSKAFKNLKSHYKVIGIIMIVFLCLYPIMIIAMVIFGVFSGFQQAGSLPV